MAKGRAGGLLGCREKEEMGLGMESRKRRQVEEAVPSPTTDLEKIPGDPETERTGASALEEGAVLTGLMSRCRKPTEWMASMDSRIDPGRHCPPPFCVIDASGVRRRDSPSCPQVEKEKLPLRGEGWTCLRRCPAPAMRPLPQAADWGPCTGPVSAMTLPSSKPGWMMGSPQKRPPRWTATGG